MEEFSMMVGKKTSEMHDKQVMDLLKKNGIELIEPDKAQQELKERGYSVTIDELGEGRYKLRLLKVIDESYYRFTYKFKAQDIEEPKVTKNGK